MRQEKPEADAVRGLTAFGGLFSCFFCMLASGALLNTPVLGGALCFMGQCALLLISLGRPARVEIVPVPVRRAETALLIASALLFSALIAVSPIAWNDPGIWRLCGLVLCVLLRSWLTRRAGERALTGGKKNMGTWGIQALFLLPVLLLLLFSPLDRGAVWALAGGYAVSGLWEAIFPERGEAARPLSDRDQQEIAALNEAWACRVYQYALMAAAAGLQLTQAMAYAFIALNAGSLLPGLALALLCVCAAGAGTDALLRSVKKEISPLFLLEAGLMGWLLGLGLFIGFLNAPVGAYLSLVLCAAGAAACLRALAGLMGDMGRVAAFAADREPGEAAEGALRTRFLSAALMGRTAALMGLALTGIFTAGFSGDWAAVFRSGRPLFTVPALACVFAAMLFAVRFPLSRQQLKKLRRYEALRREGRENAPLHDQLEAAAVKKSRRRYGIKAVIFTLWPLCYHRVRGRDKVTLDEDVPCVFVCNHGEIYGPVVATLYIPFSFRTWVTYEITDVNIIADRTMNGAFQNVKGPWRAMLDWIMRKLGAPFVAWVMRSLDSIPVYHDNPRGLMQTFRETVAAMQAGDNILIFPENAQTSADHKYAREGVSEFFTGFTMVGQLYYSKTGKCPLFVPLYADRHRRTITFGTPARYDPDVPPNEEKERLCAYLREEMLKIAEGSRRR